MTHWTRVENLSAGEDVYLPDFIVAVSGVVSEVTPDPENSDLRLVRYRETGTGIEKTARLHRQESLAYRRSA